jgi:hypothetical protein
MRNFSLGSQLAAGLNKVLKVIKSCKNPEQIQSARNLITNYVYLLKNQGVSNIECVETFLVDALNHHVDNLWGNMELRQDFLCQQKITE